MEASINWQEDTWLTLAEPAHGRTDNPRYLNLLAALDEGWEIALPIYKRPRWIDDREYVYHFILKRSDRNGTRLITVPEDDVIRTFIREHNLQAH